MELNQKHRKTIVCVTHDEAMLKPNMRLIKMEDGRITSDATLWSYISFSLLFGISLFGLKIIIKQGKHWVHREQPPVWGRNLWLKQNYFQSAYF